MRVPDPDSAFYHPPPTVPERGHPVAEALALLLALVVGGLTLYLVTSWGYGVWHRDVARAARPPGWAQRTGVVVSVGDTSYSNGVPFLPSQLSYRDYGGVTHTVTIDMPIDATHAGQAVSMWVRDDEAVYVPDSTDWTNQVSNSDPLPGDSASTGKAHQPGGGWILGVLGFLVLGGITWMVCGWAFLGLSERFGGRLGTR